MYNEHNIQTSWHKITLEMPLKSIKPVPVYICDRPSFYTYRLSKYRNCLLVGVTIHNHNF